jgi:hypothetical protein
MTSDLSLSQSHIVRFTAYFHCEHRQVISKTLELRDFITAGYDLAGALFTLNLYLLRDKHFELFKTEKDKIVYPQEIFPCVIRKP